MTNDCEAEEKYAWGLGLGLPTLCSLDLHMITKVLRPSADLEKHFCLIKNRGA